MPHTRVDPLTVATLPEFFAKRLTPENLHAHGPLSARLILNSGREIMVRVIAGHEDHISCEECHMTHDGLHPVTSPWGLLKITHRSIEGFWVMAEAAPKPTPRTTPDARDADIFPDQRFVPYDDT